MVILGEIITRKKWIHTWFWPGLSPGINIILFINLIQLRFFSYCFFTSSSVENHLARIESSVVNSIISSFSLVYLAFLSLYTNYTSLLVLLWYRVESTPKKNSRQESDFHNTLTSSTLQWSMLKVRTQA